MPNKLLIKTLTVPPGGKHAGAEVVVYSNVVLGMYTPREPMAPFSVAVEDSDMYRVSLHGENIIDDLTDDQIDKLNEQMTEHANNECVC